MAHAPASKDLMTALDALAEAVDANLAGLQYIARRIQTIKAEASTGRSLGQIVAGQESPLIVEVITENLRRLQEIGATLRWLEASILQTEGWTNAEIARHLSVSRQRVSAILNQPPKSINQVLPGRGSKHLKRHR